MRGGHGQAGQGRPRLARPVTYSNHGPKPDPACEIPISQTVGDAPSARFHLTDHLLGLACDILRSVALLLLSCGSSSPKFGGHTVLVRPRPAAVSLG